MVAIFLSFYVVLLGSCRRWSSRWIIQKGFLAANALCVSLGTYSIGSMQSSPVKSKMYPVWSVSLLALFAGIDSINAFTLDYSSQSLKLLYQMILYSGYVVVISISASASGTLAAAIGVLCAVTFGRGFHRMVAYTLPNKIRVMSRCIADQMEDNARANMRDVYNFDVTTMENCPYMLLLPLCSPITLGEVWRSAENSTYYNNNNKDTLLSFCLCHLLQRRIFGFRCDESGRRATLDFVLKGLLEVEGEGDSPNYERAFKVIEVELGFMYDYIYSSDPFVHYYEVGASTLWTTASIFATCFLAVVVSLQLAAGGSSHSDSEVVTGAAATIVETTIADMVVTLVILVSLAALQLVQLVRCWSSNWATVYLLVYELIKEAYGQKPMGGLGAVRRLGLLSLGRRIKWPTNKYQWKNKLGQWDLFTSANRNWLRTADCRQCIRHSCFPYQLSIMIYSTYKFLGLVFIEQMVTDMLGLGRAGSVQLTAEVKQAIIHALFACRRFDGTLRLMGGSASLFRNNMSTLFIHRPIYPRAKAYLQNLVIWHIATCYCKMAITDATSDLTPTTTTNIEVSTTLSNYCAYLAVKAPELLPGNTWDTRSVFRLAVIEAEEINKNILQLDERELSELTETPFKYGVLLGRRLQEEPVDEQWKVMADFWAEMILLLAPSDSVDAHVEQLAKGGEFITHLWALLYHANIQRPSDEPEEDRLQPAAAGT